MNLPEEAPKLPKLPFLIGDGVLIATAFFIGRNCASPIGPWPLLAITLCVVCGAVLATIPFLANYAKQQDAELTERQNQIAALARTTAESAEQLSIAASSLNGIAEASATNLKLIEQLPQQLQEHIKDLQKQLTETTRSSSASVKEEATLIDAAAKRITQTVADLAKLETSSRQYLTTTNETLAKIPPLTEQSTIKIGEMFDAAATTAMAAAKAQALADIELHLTTVLTRAAAHFEANLPETPRRKRHVSPSAVESEPTEPLTTESAAEIVSEPIAPPQPPAATIITEETSPLPSAATETSAPPSAQEILSTPADPTPDEVPVTPAPKTRVRHPKTHDDAGLDLELSVDAPANETSLSSDGFTRLIATAYIGIGNKLFIRGEGPGLSWEKGVPLQFVSIGKWRWETPDATAPISAKLYKNDQIECTSVGTLTLEPGHQHEVNAGF